MDATDFLLAALVFFFIATSLYLTYSSTRKALEASRDKFMAETRRSLADMFIFADPALLWRINLLALALIPMLAWLLSGSMAVGIMTALAVAFSPQLILRFLQQRRFLRLHDQLPDTLLMMASSLRGGANLTKTVEGLAKDLSTPMRDELSLVVREQRLGTSFEDALANLAGRVRSQDFDLVISALRINRQVGGNLADTLQRLGETVRRRLMMEQKVRALTSQGKLQGIVMTALPVLIVLALLRIEPEATSQLFHSLQGWAVLSIALALEVLGYWGIRKITNIEV